LIADVLAIYPHSVSNFSICRYETCSFELGVTIDIRVDG
jgi:hypothetical protein